MLHQMTKGLLPGTASRVIEEYKKAKEREWKKNMSTYTRPSNEANKEKTTLTLKT